MGIRLKHRTVSILIFPTLTWESECDRAQIALSMLVLKKVTQGCVSLP